ncbi:MAG TPA: hypothetical protein VH116_01645 [Gemmatimonadales bacterium]|jgi:hypothetical protein|nr:hypothetical protein [Gemmatimonadales bacterium]
MRALPRPGPRGAPTEGPRLRPTRAAVALGLGLGLAAASCNLSTPPTASPYVALNPVLDSMFVGDTLPAPGVTYYDASGAPQTPASVSWSSSDTSILGVSASGQLTGRKRGIAVALALVQGQVGGAVVAVANPLDLTLLLDTVYAMLTDTLTIPVAVKKRAAPLAVVWFQAPANAVYTIDSATGRLTATGAGGPIPYFVHADSIADTGAVTVLTLSDTLGGQFFFSVVGTAVGHVGGSIRAANYRRSDGGRAFQLRGTYPATGVTTQTVEIILPDSVTAPGAVAIDSLGLTEATGGLAPYCVPPRRWALWLSRSPPIEAYSRRPFGTLVIAQLVTVAHGQAISGHFRYTAQRADLYTNPLGVLTIQGSFVAPLVPTDLTVCR